MPGMTPKVCDSSTTYHICVTALLVEMVFDLEEEHDERPEVREVLPLKEQSGHPRQQRTPRKTIVHGLPASLSALGPISAPKASSSSVQYERRPTSPIQEVSIDIPTHANNATNGYRSTKVENDEPWSERELQILTLVAANTPSHRGAWTRDSVAWKKFTHQSSRSESETEDGDDDDDNDEDGM
jgi:hypothetical protein